ncbi:adenosine kinase [Rickettsiales bacterium]|nr:adenosine kinase [Rickettsiales bacterium]
MEKIKKILGMGNAVLDIIFSSDDNEIKDLGLTKGQMSIVDQKTSDKTILGLEVKKKSSGGSVANTIAGIGILGQDVLFCGRVRNDKIGQDFIEDITKSGVEYLCEPANEGPQTAKCLVFVTDDGERTMQTFLGASVNLEASDIKEEYFNNVSILIIEGYLWSSESARNAILKTVEFAKNNNIKVAFSLSDAGLVEAFKQDFREFIKKYVDILIGNESEFFALFNQNNNDELKENVFELVKLAVMTSGSKGAILFNNDNFKTFSSFPNDNILDSTGAGDMFAAGFLFKLNQGKSLEESVTFGCNVASKILSQYGARPDKEMFKEFTSV